jgi:hypothetical protein
MFNVCPECGEANLCDTCIDLFDREAEAMQAMMEEDCCSIAADKFLAGLSTPAAKINIASGEDVCLF